jgi:putative Mg2+ transporter-C (MgtC) family protein
MDIFQNELFVSLLIAMALGMALGVERFVAGKTAGMRTYTLVSLGSAAFVIISRLVTEQSASYEFDPLRVAAQIVAAAGFLGVGAIFHRDNHLSGVTTATGLWVAAGVGMAAGFGLYQLALIVTILTLVTFVVLWFLEAHIRRWGVKKGDTEKRLTE